MARITRRFVLTLSLAGAFAPSVPATAQTLEELTAEGGTRILRESGHLDEFLAHLERLRPGVLAKPRERMPRGQGLKIHELYREAWFDYLDAQDAEGLTHDFLGRPATGTLNGQPVKRVYRLKNFEIWLEHSARGSGDRHNTDLVVWELDVDSDGKVRGARGVSTDLHTRHPLDRGASNASRVHFRAKAHTAEVHVQDAANRGLRVELDAHPDRSFYYHDHLLGRGAGPEHRYSIAEIARKEDYWFTEGGDRTDRRGLDATRRLIGFKQDGTVDEPSRLTATPVDDGPGPRLPRLRSSVIGAGIALASIGTAEASAVMTAVADPSLKVGRLFRLLLAEDWETLDRLLGQSTISTDVMGELAGAGSYSAVYTDKILDYLRRKVREATHVLYFDGQGAQIRLGDGKFVADSSDARALGPAGVTRSGWGGRIRLPDRDRIRGLKLVFTELKGIDRGLRVEIGPEDDRVELTTLGNGRNVGIPLDVPADGLVVVRLTAHKTKAEWDEVDIDDLSIVSPALEYFVSKP